MRLVACAVVLLLASACGGTKARVTEADVELSSPISVHEVFEMSQRHQVKLTQIVSNDVGSDHHTVGVMVRPDMDEQDVAGVSGGKLTVNHFFVSPQEDRLHALEDEPGVSTFVKPENLPPGQ
jgi:hypothetical protein